MTYLYIIGITFGIIILYSVITWLSAGLICFISGNDGDGMLAFLAWAVGAGMFVALAVLTLDKLGYWNLPT